MIKWGVVGSRSQAAVFFLHFKHSFVDCLILTIIDMWISNLLGLFKGYGLQKGTAFDLHRVIPSYSDVNVDVSDSFCR